MEPEAAAVVVVVVVGLAVVERLSWTLVERTFERTFERIATTLVVGLLHRFRTVLVAVDSDVDDEEVVEQARVAVSRHLLGLAVVEAFEAVVDV